MADKGGLEGVVVARSRLCSIDGHNGILVYSGYDVGDLAEHSSYEEVCFLTLHGRLPLREEMDEFVSDLAAHRELSEETDSVVDMLATHAAPMEMLRTAVSSDSFDDPDKDSNAADANVRKATRLIAKMPTMVARYHRRRSGLEPIPPDASLSHAANFLHMLNGEPVTEAAAKTFDVALILHADHEMNASTFTARVIASTLSDMHSAITGAIGALKGPLHGGANEQVMRLLQSIPRRCLGRRRDPRAAGPQGADHGLRSPGVQDLGPARGDPEALLQAAGRGGGRPALVRDVRADRAHRDRQEGPATRTSTSTRRRPTTTWGSTPGSSRRSSP